MILKVPSVLKCLEKLAEKFFEHFEKKNMLVKTIKALEMACKRLNAFKFGMTRIHTICLKACVKSRMYK